MMLHRPGGPACALVALGLLSATLAGCSSSSGGVALGSDPLAAVSTAMRTARSGHISGTTSSANGANPQTLTGAFDGDLTGEGVVHAQFVSTKGTKLPTEMRWINNALYFTRSVATVPSTETVSLFTRPPNTKPWRKLRLAGTITSILPKAFSPLALVESLKTSNVPVTKHSGESIGSVKATRLTTTRPIAIGIWLGATVDIWVGKDARIVRVRITAADGGLQYDVSDYGVAVTAVAPPASQITNSTELAVKEPTGPFVTVKSGTSGGVRWQLQRAPGTQNTVCWRWQATPPLTQTGGAKAAGPACLAPPPAQSDDASDYVQFVVVGNDSGAYDALAVQMPAGVKKLTFGFVGGKTEALAPSPLVVWVGPTSPTKAYLGVTLADGTNVACGAGAVSSVGDLTDPLLTRDLGPAAWGCIPAPS